ncbi:MAG: hypothetical protein HY746_05775 [Elusimicrobia bacterium]|nr:hypothetical protein [Elusimicrobiota bacterium]
MAILGAVKVHADYILTGTCKITGITGSPPQYCEAIFTFRSLQTFSSLSECQFYIPFIDGETCRAINTTSCSAQSGFVLSASCQGSGDNSMSFGSRGLGYATGGLHEFGKIDMLGQESGSSFFTRHYSTNLSEWYDESQ